jgi:predicted RNA-binding protein YlxR (DUF448 family)
MVKKEQIRTCIVTRKSGGKEDLIRFVIGPDENVVADIREKLPGRGVWVTNSKKIVQQACERNLFAAGFKQKVKVDGAIWRNIEDLLLDNIQRGLSMAKKSGLVITGFSKVESLARRGDVKILFHACDGKQDGVAKIKSALIACKAVGGYEYGLPQPFTRLSSARLDAALGMSNAVHVALVSGGASGSLKKQIRRFDNYCS